MAFRNRPAAGKYRAHRPTGRNVSARPGDIFRAGRPSRSGGPGRWGRPARPAAMRSCRRSRRRGVRRRRPCRTRAVALRCAARRSKSGNSSAGARSGMRAEDRDAVRKLHQFHGRRPAGVRFDRVRAAAAADEVDAVHAGEVELRGNGGSGTPPPPRPCRHARRRMLPAVLITRCAERGDGRRVAAEIPSGTLRPPVAANTTEPGIPSINCCR